MFNPANDRNSAPSFDTITKRAVPLEEDIRRLFQECKIGSENASLLTQALSPLEVKGLKEEGEVIKVRVFYQTVVS